MNIVTKRICPQSGTSRKRRGAALVEMAVVLPVFMMVILGIVEFGRAMMVSQLVTSAAREGARIGVVDGNANSDIESYVENFLSEAAGVSSEYITTTVTITPGPGSTTSGNEVGNAQARDMVKVEVAVPFDRVSYIPGDYLTGKNLRSSATMRHE